jgi:hypothetical protein
MTKLTEREKQELLADAASISRRKDFDKLRVNTRVLTPAQYLDFLNWAGAFMNEKHQDRPPIEGVFLL